MEGVVNWTILIGNRGAAHGLPKWTSAWTFGRRRGSRGGLVRFYRKIAGEGLEFGEEAVAALGSTTELATHLFRECWAPRIQGRDGGRPGGALAVGRLH